MLAKEGWIPVTGLCLLAIIVFYVASPVWSLPLLVLAVLVAWFFIETPRVIPAKPFAVVSPVDGTVESTSMCQDEWLKRQAFRVTIRLRSPGICALRSPIEGKVSDMWTNLTQGERTRYSPTEYTTWIRTDEGDDVVFSVKTLGFSRLRLDIPPGQRVGQGQRNGFVYFGAKVHVLMPANAKTEVQIGDTVQAGASVIAQLVQDTR